LPNNNAYNEQELLRLISESDRQAFTRLYSAHYSSMFKYLLFITKSKEQAEEILQDIFIKVWIKRTTLTGIQSFENYLFTMAKNRLFDIRKSADRQRAALHQMAGLDNIGTYTFDGILFKEYERLAVEAFNQMPERRKEIFVLNSYDELSAKQIAEKLDLPLTTVKKHLFEAQHFIRDFLKKHGGLGIGVVVLEILL
jgi:RNA polymerase sigma-70 factor (family 1)